MEFSWYLFSWNFTSTWIFYEDLLLYFITCSGTLFVVYWRRVIYLSMGSYERIRFRVCIEISYDVERGPLGFFTNSSNVEGVFCWKVTYRWLDLILYFLLSKMDVLQNEVGQHSLLARHENPSLMHRFTKNFEWAASMKTSKATNLLKCMVLTAESRLRKLIYIFERRQFVCKHIISKREVKSYESTEWLHCNRKALQSFFLVSTIQYNTKIIKYWKLNFERIENLIFFQEKF